MIIIFMIVLIVDYVITEGSAISHSAALLSVGTSLDYLGGRKFNYGYSKTVKYLLIYDMKWIYSKSIYPLIYFLAVTV